MSSSSTSSSDVCSESVFTQFKLFPTPKKNKIDTAEFLEACGEFLKLIGHIGSFFGPVKYELSRNIKMLASVYEENEISYKTLEDMVIDENKRAKDTATKALLNVMRYLDFVTTFFDLVQKGYAEDKLDIKESVRIAYRDTILPYHCWMMSQLFSIVCRLPSCRERFFERLALNRKLKSYDAVLDQAKKYCGRVERCLRKLNKFYRDHGLQDVDDETDEIEM